MEYVFEWRIPKRVLLLTVSGDVSLEELQQFNHCMIEFLEQGTEPVHLVSVGRDIQHVPTNLMQVKQIVSYVQHPNMGWTVIVQDKPNSIAGFMLSVAAQATGMKMRLVKSASDSFETLRRIDPSLDGYAVLV